MDGKAVLSAQVIMRSASGRTIDGRISITSDNLAEILPDPSAAAAAMEIFRSRDFVVGPIVGISFSITSTKEVFEEFFRSTVQEGEDGAFEFASAGVVIGHELPPEMIPNEIRKYVQTIVFPPPPDFGPKKFDV